MAADRTVNITGIVKPIRAAGGSKVMEPATVVEIVAKVALLDTMVSDWLLRRFSMLITVLTPAGTTTLVARAGAEDVEAGAAAVEVGAAAVEVGAAVIDELD